MRGKLVSVLAALALTAGGAGAQFLHIGNPDIGLTDLTSGGKPTVLTIRGLANITSYAFNGTNLQIPFTLDGGGATVWLIIYTEGYKAPYTIEGEGPGTYADPEHSQPGWHVYEGVDVLVYKSPGQRFAAGDNTITWNGKDLAGNNVKPGSYNLYLAAFDDQAVPHVVGVAPAQFGSGQTILFNTQRSEMYSFGSLQVCNMEADWITNLAGFDLMDNQAIADACGSRADCPTTLRAATPLDAARTEWIGNSWAVQAWLYRFHYDWATRKITMDEDWATGNGAETGILNLGDVLPGRQYHSATNPAKSEVYVTAGVSGTVSKIATWKVADGAFVPSKEWDLSDIFLYDNNGADRSSGPGTLARFFNGEPDPSGLTMSGHHTSLTVRTDFDGNILWMNRNGDGFGDSRVYASGTFGDLAYGHTEAPAFKYSLYATSFGWVTNIEAGSDNSRNGFMLGEDGSGLFNFEPKGVPLSWPMYNVVIDEDGPWDGVYMSIGAFGNEAAANTFDTAPGYPIVQLPYDQKRVSLGVPTAVLEREGATPDAFKVSDAYPNPFNPETSIRFQLPWAAAFKVTVFNDHGQAVRTLVDERSMGPGTFDVTWDGMDDNGRQVATGVYLYLIEGPDLQTHKKVTYLK